MEIININNHKGGFVEFVLAFQLMMHVMKVLNHAC